MFLAVLYISATGNEMSSDLFNEGMTLFNAAHYFEAHEVWEDLWRQSHGDARLHCQGLIHAAVGLLHIQRGNRVGARNQLKKCLEKLRRSPVESAGIDNRDLMLQIAAIAQALEKPESADAVIDAPPRVRVRRL